MMKTTLTFLITLLFLSQNFMAQTDDELKKIFREHIEWENAGSSMVMVEVSEKGTRFVNYGKLSKNSTSPNADEKTIYEIGSITKVFTGILLAESVKRGEVKLDDSISKYLPKTVKTPTFNGKEITLIDLATHTSALPRLPDNLAPKNPLNPYADYTAQNAYDFLSSYKLTREIGSKYDYSNFATGLLGHILSLRTKMSFEKLMTDRILKPLGMNDTSFFVPPAKKKRFAQGLDDNNNPIPYWDFDALAGAGALRSTSADMAKFISANLGLSKAPLATVLAEAVKMRRQTDSANSQIGLGWHSLKLFGNEIIWHNGGTGGFLSYLVFDPKQKKGAFLVTNSADNTSMQFIESVALNSLNNKFPIRKPSPPKKETILSEDVLDKYLGEYQLAPTFSIFITREGKQLFAEATGQGKFEIFAEKEDLFFAKVAKISISFKKDANGKVIEMILTQSGQDVPGKKIK